MSFENLQHVACMLITDREIADLVRTKVNTVTLDRPMFLPGTIFYLPHLTTLNLDFFNFWTHPSHSLNGLNELIQLRSFNLTRYCAEQPENIFLFLTTNLTRLSLTECNLRSLPNGIKQFKHLQVLDISGNKFKEDFPENVCFLSGLTALSVSSCELRKISNNLSQLTKLRSLDVSDNLLDDFGVVGSLSTLTRLKSNSWGLGNYFSTKSIKLVNLRILEIVSYANIPIDSIKVRALTLLPKLEVESIIMNNYYEFSDSYDFIDYSDHDDYFNPSFDPHE